MTTELILSIRPWLNTFESLRPLQGATAIIEKFQAYKLDLTNILHHLKLKEEDVDYADRTQIIEEWISLNPL